MIVLEINFISIKLIYYMNQAWLSSMKLHYLKCYYGQPVADIE